MPFLIEIQHHFANCLHFSHGILLFMIIFTMQCHCCLCDAIVYHSVCVIRNSDRIIRIKDFTSSTVRLLLIQIFASLQTFFLLSFFIFLFFKFISVTSATFSLHFFYIQYFHRRYIFFFLSFPGIQCRAYLILCCCCCCCIVLLHFIVLLSFILGRFC